MGLGLGLGLNNSANKFGGVAQFINLLSTDFNGVDEIAQDGSDASLEFDFDNPFSFSFWQKLDDLTGSQRILNKREGAGTFRGWDILTQGSVYIFILSANFGTGDVLDMRSNSGIAQSGVWNHIVFTYDGSRTPAGVKLYRNASNAPLITSTDNLTTDAVYTVPMTVAANPTPVSHMAGRLDEVSIYDIELSQANVTTIYNSGVPNDLESLGFGANLITWYRMGDGDTSPTIADQIGSNDLTTTNMDSSNFVTDTP